MLFLVITFNLDKGWCINDLLMTYQLLNQKFINQSLFVKQLKQVFDVLSACLQNGEEKGARYFHSDELK
jgi:hypothetical protein